MLMWNHKTRITLTRCLRNSTTRREIGQYKYLDVLFTEHLDLMQMAKIVAQSASRALGLLISKDKVVGGMPFECFTQCYGATVQSIIDYSAAVWGTKSMSCINAVQNRACRFSWDLADMHQMLLLMVTWVGYPQSIVNGCAFQENGAD